MTIRINTYEDTRTLVEQLTPKKNPPIIGFFAHTPVGVHSGHFDMGSLTRNLVDVYILKILQPTNIDTINDPRSKIENLSLTRLETDPYIVSQVDALENSFNPDYTIFVNVEMDILLNFYDFIQANLNFINTQLTISERSMISHSSTVMQQINYFAGIDAYLFNSRKDITGSLMLSQALSKVYSHGMRFIFKSGILPRARANIRLAATPVFRDQYGFIPEKILMTPELISMRQTINDAIHFNSDLVSLRNELSDLVPDEYRVGVSAEHFNGIQNDNIFPTFGLVNTSLYKILDLETGLGSDPSFLPLQEIRFIGCDETKWFNLGTLSDIEVAPTKENLEQNTSLMIDY